MLSRCCIGGDEWLQMGLHAVTIVSSTTARMDVIIEKEKEKEKKRANIR